MACVAGIAGPGAIVRTRQACRHAPTGVSDCRRELRRTAAILLRGPQTSACGGESGCFPAIAQALALVEGSTHGLIAARAGSCQRADSVLRPEPRPVRRAAGAGSVAASMRGRRRSTDTGLRSNRRCSAVPCFLRVSGWPPNRLGICRGASRMPALRRVAANERNVQIARIGGDCRRKRACGTILPQASLQPA